MATGIPGKLAVSNRLGKRVSNRVIPWSGYDWKAEAVRGCHDNSAKADLRTPVTLSNQWKYIKGKYNTILYTCILYLHVKGGVRVKGLQNTRGQCSNTKSGAAIQQINQKASYSKGLAARGVAYPL